VYDYNTLSSTHFQCHPLPLELVDNNVGGSLPEEIKVLTSLRTFDLLFNNIEGTIPDVLTELPNLVFFDVERNQLAGPAFVDLTGLTSLESYRVSFNELTGMIPPEIFTDLPALRELFAANNTLDGSIPGEIGEAANLGTSEFVLC